jgi:predicted nucleotide-binding protein
MPVFRLLTDNHFRNHCKFVLMKIAISGSWKEKNRSDWDLREKSSFFEACRQIGVVIGMLDNSEIIVNSDVKDAADRYVLQGIIESVKNNGLSRFPVWVIYPKNGASPFENLNEQEREYLTIRRDPIQLPYKTEAHFMSVDEADIVITIGGGFTTYLSGSYAMLSRKKIVPIASFGGASKKILDKLLQSMHSNAWRRADLDTLGRDWNEQVLSAVQTLVQEFPLVWIMHGRAKNDLNDLKKFLEDKLKIYPIVMEEEFLSGKTPTEKFEGLASRVQCAIILATPDDVGGLKKENGTALELKPRARQNVWLEAGWFWAALGREKVLFLKRDPIEIPSDWGIVYERLPSENGEAIIKFVEGIRKH